MKDNHEGKVEVGLLSPSYPYRYAISRSAIHF
jgi:hypothetical protein